MPLYGTLVGGLTRPGTHYHQIVVLRYILKCTNCGARTMFRIRVGFSDKDPFQYECQRCSQLIRGELHLDQENVKILGLANLEGAVEARDNIDEADFAQMHDSYFLIESASTRPEDFSAFIKAHQRVGESLFIRSQSAAFLERVINKERPTLIRIIKNYDRSQWEHFRAGLAEYLSEVPADTEAGRVQGLLTLFDMAFAPFIASERHKDFIERGFQCAADCEYLYRRALPLFLADLRGQGLLERAHRDSTSLGEKTLMLAEDIRPLIVDWDPENPMADIGTKLRVSVERFDWIKATYVDAYEVLCRDLTIATGLVNLRERGDHNRYPTHPMAARYRRFAPRTMLEFHDLAHAPKIPLLVGYPLFGHWMAALDSKLRNAIGHNAVTSDPRTGIITYTGEGGRQVEITYANFLCKLLSSLLFVHEFHWLVAFLWIHFVLEPGGAAAEKTT